MLVRKKGLSFVIDFDVAFLDCLWSAWVESTRGQFLAGIANI